MTPPQAFVFDWDGTLADTLPLIHACLNAAMRAVGKREWSMAEVQRGIHRSARESFPLLFGEQWQTAYDVYYQHFEANHVQQSTPLPGALEFVRKARAAGLYTAVVSNKKGDYLRREVAHLGWNDYFGAVVGAGDAPQDKPSPLPFELAMQASPLARGRHIWFIGDSITDMQCAYASGCTAVLVRTMPPEKGEFAGSEPHLYAPNCHALTEILGKSGIPCFTAA